jgi:hypothetical protein
MERSLELGSLSSPALLFSSRPEWYLPARWIYQLPSSLFWTPGVILIRVPTIIVWAVNLEKLLLTGLSKICRP